MPGVGEERAAAPDGPGGEGSSAKAASARRRGAPPATLDGDFALHDIRAVDWAGLRRLHDEERRAVAQSLVGYARECEAAGGPDGARGSSAAYRVVGHKGDILFVHFRRTLDELAELERRSALGPFSDVLRRTYSYVSVVELSRHAAPPTRPGADPSRLPEVARRLHPSIPDRSYVCFYPMSKRRGEKVNWYLLSPEERRALMQSHGRIGHAHADRVTQIITGSIGLDDWEWGVTLFGDDPIAFKRLVYEMRFDEASAAYAEFGPFFVGIRTPPDAWAAWLLAGGV